MIYAVKLKTRGKKRKFFLYPKKLVESGRARLACEAVVTRADIVAGGLLFRSLRSRSLPRSLHAQGAQVT